MKKPKNNKIGILIADDEEINFQLLKILLNDVFQIYPKLYHAKNGQEAINIFSSDPDKIDLILMDLKMPLIDGFEATKTIRALNSDIPIIAQTAFNTDEYKERANESGCNDLIAKPISRNTFSDILNKHLMLKV